MNPTINGKPMTALQIQQYLHKLQLNDLEPAADLATLKKLRDLGNTLIVVEHDEDTMYAADQIIDIGPGAGENGGYVVAEGTPKEVMENINSITGRYLKGIEKIEIPEKVILVGASETEFHLVVLKYKIVFQMLRRAQERTQHCQSYKQ